MIAKLSAQMREIFTDSFRAINENFSRVFTELFGGGEASLVLEDESDVLACGIGIRVAPPGKVIKNLEALSGGEQALVAIRPSSSSSPTAAAPWRPPTCCMALPCRKTACPNCSSWIWNRLTQRWFPDIK